MKIVLRALLVWLMLLAVPFQGFASASMLLCAPISKTADAASQVAAAGQGMHDHAAMLAAHDVQAEGQDADDGGAGGHGSAHCAATSACCVGALLASSLPELPAQAASSQRIPFYSGVPSAVDLAGLERPPRASRN